MRLTAGVRGRAGTRRWSWTPIRPCVWHWAGRLAHEGYRVRTCVGPTVRPDCPGVNGDGEPCRLPDDLAVAYVDQASARTPLLAAYPRWRPGGRDPAHRDAPGRGGRNRGEVAMSDVKQCPRCELRFRAEQELVWRLAHDHDKAAAGLAQDLVQTAVERHRESRRRRSPTPTAMREAQRDRRQRA
jgi:hypothetical protein